MFAASRIPTPNLPTAPTSPTPVLSLASASSDYFRKCHRASDKTYTLSTTCIIVHQALLIFGAGQFSDEVGAGVTPFWALQEV